MGIEVRGLVKTGLNLQNLRGPWEFNQRRAGELERLQLTAQSGRFLNIRKWKVPSRSLLKCPIWLLDWGKKLEVRLKEELG